MKILIKMSKYLNIGVLQNNSKLQDKFYLTHRFNNLFIAGLTSLGLIFIWFLINSSCCLENVIKVKINSLIIMFDQNIFFCSILLLFGILIISKKLFFNSLFYKLDTYMAFTYIQLSFIILFYIFLTKYYSIIGIDVKKLHNDNLILESLKQTYSNAIGSKQTVISSLSSDTLYNKLVSSDIKIFSDSLSLWLVFLTLIVSSTMFLYNSVNNENKILNFKKNSTAFIIAISILSVAAFLTTNMFIFFICFEMIVIPVSVYVLMYGSRIEKQRAVTSYIIYTILGSSFLWFVLAHLFSNFGSLDFSTIFNIINSNGLSIMSNFSGIYFILLFIGFGFKVPLYPVSSWLLTAHVEAPTLGSVSLAALVLKMGGYGLYKFTYLLFPNEVYYWYDVLVCIGIVGFAGASFQATRQTDLKRFVALTSIAHMNLSVAALFSGREYGIYGFFFTMISHGITATALFFIIGHIYSNTHKRDTTRISGLALTQPTLAFLFILFLLSNMGMPGLPGFPGEFFCFTSLFNHNIVYIIILLPAYLLTGIYTFNLISKIIWGSVDPVNTNTTILLSSGIKSALIILSTISLCLGLLPDNVIKTVGI